MVAPFVAKTYQMVSDPSTDALIRWGKGNNSFVVVDPGGLSQFLLPSFFKHNNFSSFIRQLNTYGFRKVDPDRWEFAHESFLRGQIHLLPQIVRRRKRVAESGDVQSSSASYADVAMGCTREEEEIDAIFQELKRLRQEQQALEQELQVMNRRLRATEQRPDQLMSFLFNLAKDPDVIHHLISSKKQQLQAAQKKRRLLQIPISPPLSPPPAAPLLVAGDIANGDRLLTIGDQEQFASSLDCPTEPNTFSDGLEAQGAQQVPEVGVNGSSDPTLIEPTVKVPFPFSILGQGFF